MTVTMIYRLVLSLSCVCAFLSAAAHGSGDTLGAPSYDHATEATYRQVTWDDFQGRGQRPPGWNRWSQGSFALIATALRLNKYQIEDRQDGDEWLATTPGIRPYAIVNKDFSAVKHGSKNTYTLAHEQLHFDIAEAFARRLTVELIPFEGRGATRAAAQGDLVRQLQARLDSAMRELGELQARYDGETEHGERKKKQKKWAAEVPEMFRQATEALIALRGE